MNRQTKEHTDIKGKTERWTNILLLCIWKNTHTHTHTHTTPNLNIVHHDDILKYQINFNFSNKRQRQTTNTMITNHINMKYCN